VALLCASGCFQKLESGAASNTQPRLDADPGPTTKIEPGSIPIEIGPTEGDHTTSDPCDATNEQMKQIFTQDCAGCHGGGAASMAGFDCVLDWNKLKEARSTLVKDPGDDSKGARLLIPGSPDDSRIYQMFSSGKMPPPDRAGCCVNGTCRGNGQVCGGGLNGTCNNGSCQNAAGMACGAANQGCCGAGVGSVCTASRQGCVGGTSCLVCGGMDERCCDGNVDGIRCLAGFECQPLGSALARCRPCGGMGQFCCGRGAVAQQTCNAGLTCRAGANGAPPVCGP